MELKELHVADGTADAPGHGDPIPGGDIGVAGVEIDLPRPAAREHHIAGGEGDHRATPAIQSIGAQATLRGQAELAGGDEVDGHMVLEHPHARVAAGQSFQRGLDGAAGGIGGMDHAPVAVAALAGQVVFGPAIGVRAAGKGDPECDQPFDALGSMLDYELHDLGVAQPGPGRQRVGHVGGHRVAVVEHGRDAALGIQGRALLQGSLREHRDLGMLRQLERDAEPRCAAADHQDIVPVLFDHPRTRAGAPEGVRPCRRRRNDTARGL